MCKWWRVVTNVFMYFPTIFSKYKQIYAYILSVGWTCYSVSVNLPFIASLDLYHRWSCSTYKLPTEDILESSFFPIPWILLECRHSNSDRRAFKS